MLNKVIFRCICDTGNCSDNLFKYKLGSLLYQLIKFTLYIWVIFLTNFRVIILFITSGYAPWDLIKEREGYILLQFYKKKLHI